MGSLHRLPITFLLLGAAITVSGQTGFAITPTDTQVIEGSSVTLSCVTITDSSRANYVQWIKGSKAISSNYTINTERLQVSEPSRYKIIGDFSRGEFNLRIENTIESQDADLYKCILMSPFGLLSISGEARLSVASPSVDQYPLCSPTELKPKYEEGERIQTACVFRHADPDPELRWRYANRIFPGHRAYESLPDIRQEWLLSYQDDGAVFTCEAVGASFPTPQTCQVGPLNVQYRPRVTVQPSQTNVVAGSNIVFTCTAQSNPAPAAYVWEINGRVVMDSSNKYSFSDNGRIFTITNVGDGEAGISVSCLASNNIGLGVSETPAKVEVFHSDGEPVKNVDPRTVTPTSRENIEQEQTADPKTLAIIVVAVAAGLAVIFSIVVLICFRKTIGKCCQSGICWRTNKPVEVNTENKISNLAEMSTMIALKHKLEQFEQYNERRKESIDSERTPYTPEITVV